MTPETAELTGKPALQPLPRRGLRGRLAIAAQGAAVAGAEADAVAVTERAAVQTWGRLPSWPLRPSIRARLAGEGALARSTALEALVSSRLIVWLAGSGAVLALGFGPARKAFEHAQLTGGFGAVGNVLMAPAARWDSGWYLLIARAGYAPGLGSLSLARSAFFPVYPLAMRTLSLGFIPLAATGVAVSLTALAVALYLLHRLSALEIRSQAQSKIGISAEADEIARLAVFAAAFAPMAFFFSAIYSESLYLALSLGVFWSARNGRWAQAGILAALAGATRPTGILLIVPVLIFYLYGPRAERTGSSTVVRSSAPAGSGLMRRAAISLRPRYRLQRDALWLLLAPVGVVAFMAFLAQAGGNPMAPFSAEQLWGRQLAGPFVGLWDGAVAAFDGLRQLLSMQSHHAFLAHTSGNPLVAASHNVPLFAFALLAIAATVGVLRRLPIAYGAYTLLALALPLSYPVAGEPLMSLPRFLLVLFPVYMWLAIWLKQHPRMRRPLFMASTMLLAFFCAAFATWHWVA